MFALSEVNYNLREHQFCGMEAVRKIMDIRKLIFRYLINNPYPRQDDLTPDIIKNNIYRQSYGNITIKLPTQPSALLTKQPLP